MIKKYLKQAWELLKQNPLFSTLYIVGTGLAIAMIMVIAVIYYVKIAPVYPEMNRLQTHYLTKASFETGVEGNKNIIQWTFSYKALQDWFYPLKNAEVVSASLYAEMAYNSYIQPADKSGDFGVPIKLTDPNFFRIYSFHFTEGKPFTTSDLNSGLYTAVVTEELARRLFGTSEGVVGRSFSLNNVNCRICGVVRSASYLTGKSYSQIYIPYSVVPDYKESQYGTPYPGAFSLTFLTKDNAQAKALHAEVGEIVRKSNLINNFTVNIWSQPTSHLQSVFQPAANKELNTWATVRQFLLMLLILLLVPALNLSGMIASRMESRMAEMGVRKAFGAGRGKLLSQVMWENLLLTLLGGLLGLILSWSILYTAREWVFTVLDNWSNPVPEGTDVWVSGEMLFAPLVFLAALLLSALINLLSALIPAWYSLRNPIIHSLNEKR